MNLRRARCPRCGVAPAAAPMQGPARARAMAVPAAATRAAPQACSCGGSCPRCALAPGLRSAHTDSAAPQDRIARPAPALDADTAQDGAVALDTGGCAAGSTTITLSEHRVVANGFNVQDAIEDADRQQGGHVASVLPVFSPKIYSDKTDDKERAEEEKKLNPFGLCPPATTPGTVQSATIAIDERKTVPRWSGRDKAPQEAQAMWDRYIAVVDAHETKHVGIDQKNFTDMHKKAVGKSTQKALDALYAVVEKADKDNKALDDQEGCIKLNGGSGKVTQHPRSDCGAAP